MRAQSTRRATAIDSTPAAASDSAPAFAVSAAPDAVEEGVQLAGSVPTAPVSVEPAIVEPVSEEDDPFINALRTESLAAPPCDQVSISALPALDLRPLNDAVNSPPTMAIEPLLPLTFDLTPLPPDATRWTELTATLADYLLSLGQTRAAALLPALLNGEGVDLSRLGKTAIERLVQDGVACRHGAQVTSNRRFRESVAVFRDEFVSGGLNIAEALFWLAQVLAGLTAEAFEPSDFEQALMRLGISELFERAA